MSFLRKLIRNNKAATAIEYGLIAALMAVTAIGALKTLSKSLNNTFNKIGSNLSST